MNHANEKIAEAPLDVSSDNQLGDTKEIIGGHDIGKALFAEVLQYSPEELDVESRKVLRLLDWHIMPVICVTYTIQFLDKLSLNYASAYTLKADLHLEGQMYSWVAAIFNFGYLFWALPSNLLIQRLPVAKYTGAMIVCWSLILICHIAAKNYAGMLVLRFFLGMFEASISPALMSICSMFYTKEEQPLRMCIFLAFNGMATMVGALLGYGLGHATGTALQSWKLIFLVIGLLNFVWSFFFLWLCPDSPASARFLDHKQRIIAVHRIARNMTGVKTPDFVLSQVLEAVSDLKVIAIALIGLACGVVNGGVSNFASALIRGYGFTGIYSTLLQLPTGAFEFFLVPICGLAATYVKNTRCITMIVICLPPLGGLIGIRLTGLDHRWTLVGCTWLQFLIGGPVVLSWNLLTTNVAGHTKRSFANGMWFILYAAGNIAGANIFFEKEAPRYFSALAGLLASYAGIIVLGVFLYACYAYENKRRDRLAGGCQSAEEEAQGIADGFLNQTDKESIYFRYSL
ncbi:MAG: hypothetical protein M1818_001956 [Claussenomyces sp. TS43310]|nr:MAG: hypothetical protein M1818_001956 [Claussenomyces sp. TS43310]